MQARTDDWVEPGRVLVTCAEASLCTVLSRVPKYPAQGVSLENWWSEPTASGHRALYGELTIQRALDESDIIDYIVYWGENATTPLRRTSTIISLPKRDFAATPHEDIRYSLNRSIPANATHILVYTSNRSGKNPSPVAWRLADRWLKGQDLQQLRQGAVSVSDGNRYLYVIAGEDYIPEHSIERFDTVTKSWELLPTIIPPSLLEEVRGVGIINEHLYVLGNMRGEGRVIEYNIVTRQLRENLARPDPQDENRYVLGAETIGATLYIIVGSSQQRYSQALVEFTPPLGETDSGRWLSSENLGDLQAPQAMLSERAAFSLCVVSGQLYMIGGESPQGEKLDDVEVYNVRRKDWMSLRPLPEPRSHHSCAVSGGRIYVFGGKMENDDPSDSHIYYDVVSRSSWQSVQDLLQLRHMATASALGNIYLIGSLFDAGHVAGSTDVYIPED